MSNFKSITFVIILMCMVAQVHAQQKDTSAKKSPFSFKLRMPQINWKKTAPSKVVTNSSIVAESTIEESLAEATQGTTISLMTGVNFSHQSVAGGAYNSNFNYNIADIGSDTYKSGFFGGVRLDSRYKNKHDYSLSASIGKLTSGASYADSKKMAPFAGNFSSFKAEESFILLNLAAHYKKLLPIGDMVRYKFYVVAGPSVDFRLSNTSLDNQVNNVYKKMFFTGDAGIEFSNRKNYNLFFHYHKNLGSITNAGINTGLSSFQIGMSVKATDLF